MWVITASKGIEHQRDNKILDILEEKPNFQFLSKRVRGNSKYSTTPIVEYAIIFKTESGALRLIKNFNSDTNKSYFTSKFSWIKDYVLSVRKLTKEEWERFINFEISRLDNKYQKQRYKLLDKKNQYK
jgi:hypothetical protein